MPETNAPKINCKNSNKRKILIKTNFIGISLVPILVNSRNFQNITDKIKNAVVKCTDNL